MRHACWNRQLFTRSQLARPTCYMAADLALEHVDLFLLPLVYVIKRCWRHSSCDVLEPEDRTPRLSRVNQNDQLVAGRRLLKNPSRHQDTSRWMVSFHIVTCEQIQRDCNDDSTSLLNTLASSKLPQVPCASSKQEGGLRSFEERAHLIQ